MAYPWKSLNFSFAEINDYSSFYANELKQTLGAFYIFYTNNTLTKFIEVMRLEENNKTK